VKLKARDLFRVLRSSSELRDTPLKTAIGDFVGYVNSSVENLIPEVFRHSHVNHHGPHALHSRTVTFPIIHGECGVDRTSSMPALSSIFFSTLSLSIN
jgi:hypothetical protein